MGKATPNAEQRRLVALWRESTLSRAAFAKAHAVRPGTFGSWVARHELMDPAPASSCTFIQVAPPPAPPSSPAFIVHVDDHALRFAAPPPPAWFAAVLRELAPC